MYQCKKCGQHQQGQSDSGLCPGCTPAATAPVNREGNRVRCGGCGQTFETASRSPQLECPHCGGMVYVRRATAEAPSRELVDAERVALSPGVRALADSMGALVEAARLVEREAVVKWLRAESEHGYGLDFVDRIEAGEHVE
jgi:predicted  nucleic acid-binding Zn-ribbon protein